MKTKLLSSLISMLAAGSLMAGDYVSKAPAEAASYLPASEWEFEFILYGWGAGIDGTTGVLGTTTDVDVSFSDILDELDMGAMAAFGVRKGRVGFLGDFMYLDIRPSYETPGSLFGRTDLNLQETMVNLVASYRVAEWDGGWFDIIGGGRYMNIDLEIELQPGRANYHSARGSDYWWDAVGGFRTQHHLTENVFLTALADIGGGSSDLTWQALAGIGYRFTPNVSATLAYRALDYDYVNDGFTFDISTRGVALGLGITW